MLNALFMVLGFVDVRKCAVHILHGQSDSGEEMSLHGGDRDYHIGIDQLLRYLLYARNALLAKVEAHNLGLGEVDQIHSLLIGPFHKS